MLRNVIEPLISGKSALKHVSILQGTKAYGVHLHPIAIPARESDPRDDHANFFFDQQDRSEEHTSELQSPDHLVCRLLLEKKNTITHASAQITTSYLDVHALLCALTLDA